MSVLILVLILIKKDTREVTNTIKTALYLFHLKGKVFTKIKAKLSSLSSSIDAHFKLWWFSFFILIRVMEFGTLAGWWLLLEYTMFDLGIHSQSIKLQQH